VVTGLGKGKAILVEDRANPEGSKSLYPQEIFLVLVSVKG
jgi:hypothetical protein